MLSCSAQGEGASVWLAQQRLPEPQTLGGCPLTSSCWRLPRLPESAIKEVTIWLRRRSSSVREDRPAKTLGPDSQPVALQPQGEKARPWKAPGSRVDSWL